MSNNSDNLNGCLIIFGIIIGLSLIISIIQILITFIINNYKIILIILSIFIIIAIIITILITKNKRNKKQSTTYNNYSITEYQARSPRQVIDTTKHEYTIDTTKHKQTTNTKTQQQLFEEEAIKILNRISNSKIIPKKQSKYHLKTKTITDNEQYFLDIVKKHFSKQYEIRPQVPLSSIIEKDKNFSREYQNELNRIIDIGIFSKETTAPLLLIEINDSTHEQKHRRVRDNKVKEICKEAQISLITFWLKYSNTEQYIVERISKEISRNSIK